MLKKYLQGEELESEVLLQQVDVGTRSCRGVLLRTLLSQGGEYCGGSAGSLLQLPGLSSSSMVDSNSEMTAEGVDSGFCNSVSSHGIFEPIVEDSSLTDLQLPSFQIVAQSERGLSPRASPPVVSESPASTASAEHNFSGGFSAQLELAEPFEPDVLEPTIFRAPLLSEQGAGENWRSNKSNDVCSARNAIDGEQGTPPHLHDNVSNVGGVGHDASQPNCVECFGGLEHCSADVGARCMHVTEPTMQKQPSWNASVFQESSSGAATDSMRPSCVVPYLGVHSSLSSISGPPSFRPLFAFPVSEACDEPNVIPDHMRALLFRAAAGEIESARPKRRNIRISTDPQTVAARHRRERISDRIRVLQRLVPGGTKMDTASMLDEAIHYVKFLKLQLQALEQLGNSFDPNFTMGMPAFQPIPHPAATLRPFDLNCSAYQVAAAASPSANASHSSSLTGSHITGWPRSSSSLCFQDHPQEQFCH